MNIVFGLLTIACILAAGFFLTVKVIPFLFVKAGRLLGFRMKLNKITEKRISRFKRIKRGYYAFILICTMFVISLFLELLVNSKALCISYNGRYAFPAVAEWFNQWTPFIEIASYNKKSDFGLTGDEPVNYRKYVSYCNNPEKIKELIEERKKELQEQNDYLKSLGAPPPAPTRMDDPGEDAPLDALMRYQEYKRKREKWQSYLQQQNLAREIAEEIPQLETFYENLKAGKAFVVMPLYPHGPQDYLLNLPGKPPYLPTWWPHLKSFFTGEPLPENTLPAWTLPLGSTDNARDVIPQLVYGFRISLVFALIVAAVGYSIGVIVGGVMGYYGGWIDIITQRVIEIYGSIPFLFTIMIIASIVQPSLLLLAAIMIVLRSWLGITYYIRGEFYREKAKDYVQSAIGTGVSDWKIMVTHIAPNAIVPVVTFAPFGIVGYIILLVSLDYLGFGLPPGSPSWGYLLNQGSVYLESYPHLIITASLALAATLFCVVLIGEAVREAFDPKVFSRLR